MKEGDLLGIFSEDGVEAKIGDRIQFANTEGLIMEHYILWDQKNLCVVLGGFPYVRLMESGYIQSSHPGKRHLDFNILPPI